MYSGPLRAPSNLSNHKFFVLFCFVLIHSLWLRLWLSGKGVTFVYISEALGHEFIVLLAPPPPPPKEITGKLQHRVSIFARTILSLGLV